MRLPDEASIHVVLIKNEATESRLVLIKWSKQGKGRI